MAKVSQMALPDATGNAGGFHSWHTQIVTSIGSDCQKSGEKENVKKASATPSKTGARAG